LDEIIPAPATPQHWRSKSVIVVTALISCAVSFDKSLVPTVSFSVSSEASNSSMAFSSRVGAPASGFSASIGITPLVRCGNRENMERRVTF